MGQTVQSERFSLNEQDWTSWAKSTAIFLIPLFTLYSTQIIGVVQNQAGFSISDLLPTQLTYGGGLLYILNAITGLLRRFAGGK